MWYKEALPPRHTTKPIYLQLVRTRGKLELAGAVSEESSPSCCKHTDECWVKRLSKALPPRGPAKRHAGGGASRHCAIPNSQEATRTAVVTLGHSLATDKWYGEDMVLFVSPKQETTTTQLGSPQRHTFTAFDTALET